MPASTEQKRDSSSLGGNGAHPNSPAGGGGAGGFSWPGSLEGNVYAWAPHPDSPSGLQAGSLTGIPTVQPSAPHVDSSILDRILHAVSWEELKHLAEIALGPSSFYLGVCYGIVESLAGAVTGLLSLLKKFVMAGLYDRAQHQPAWWDVVDLPGYVAAQAAKFFWGPELKQAYDDCEALIRELKHAVTHPLETLGKIGEGYAAKWKRFEQLFAESNLTSKFEAGKIMCELLLDVVMLILTVVDGVGLVAKVAKEIPELVRLAESLRGLKITRVERAGGAVGAAEDVTAAERAEAAAKAARDDTPISEQSNAKKGVFGEHHADAYMEKQGYKKLNGKPVELGDSPKGPGIDGVYVKTEPPPPKYVIGEAKYGSSKLGTLEDGTKQMSPEWIDERLDKAVGKRTADAIREADEEPGRVERWILKVDDKGNVVPQILKDGKP